MRRSLEFLLYAGLILFFILRYSGDDERGSARQPAPLPQGHAPENFLPVEDGGPVTVQVGERAGNSVGTAFLVNGSGTYVSARHVVDGCKQVFLADPLVGMERVLSVTVPNNRDFAILKTTRFGVKPFNLSERIPAKGEEGYFMGFPQGKPADVRATVLGQNEMRSTGKYRMREPVIAWVERERRPAFPGSLGGMSGGPVISREGHVIGSAVAESRRRGRVYTTNPHVFREMGVLYGISADRLLERGVHPTNFELTGQALRRSRAIAQVYCLAK
ncbi:MAG: trypsin-like peptidase domain-containing protein [Alphaproteobacteria bacterium]|nr:trypsin-like peptidase domain-containing protein [Alphaproteobacteria bacterium]